MQSELRESQGVLTYQVPKVPGIVQCMSDKHRDSSSRGRWHNSDHPVSVRSLDTTQHRARSVTS